MHITFLISNLSNSGGTQRILTLLCNEMVKVFPITILIHNTGKPFFHLSDEVNVIPLKGNIFTRNIQIYKILKNTNSRYYVNLDTNSILLNGFFLPSNTKLIVWEHYSLLNNFSKKLYVISRFYASLIAYKFVLLSDFEKELWQKKYNLSTSKSNVIYNPVTIAGNDIDRTNKYSNKKFIAIGNDIEVKGFDLLLKAWKIANISEWKLVIAGLDSDQLEQLVKDVENCNVHNVTILPRQKRIQDIYKNSSVLVLSSRKEATPLTITESQAFGIPAIVSNHLPGVLEQISNSALIAIHDDDYVNNLSRLLMQITNEELYNRLHLNCLSNAERFNIQHFSQQWLKLIFN
ncbi:glycosyltransferase [Chryseobacterium sp.]|uniref:glycosyltransferase n=1 Tax=Chryseobacterium sp. TaxID=1871047 RepID=UPI002FCA3D09